MGGLVGADAMCNARALAAGLNGTYLAWLSDPVTSPSMRFAQATVPYVRIDGLVIANNWTALTTATLQNPVEVMENGTQLINIMVWTGTNQFGSFSVGLPPLDGGPPADGCANWTSSSSEDSAATGSDSAVDYTWTAGMGFGGYCNFGLPIYCFEQ
jgi:hypothetical protein